MVAEKNSIQFQDSLPPSLRCTVHRAMELKWNLSFLMTMPTGSHNWILKTISSTFYTFKSPYLFYNNNKYCYTTVRFFWVTYWFEKPKHLAIHSSFKTLYFTLSVYIIEQLLRTASNYKHAGLQTACQTHTGASGGYIQSKTHRTYSRQGSSML